MYFLSLVYRFPPPLGRLRCYRFARRFRSPKRPCSSARSTGPWNHIFARQFSLSVQSSAIRHFWRIWWRTDRWPGRPAACTTSAWQFAASSRESPCNSASKASSPPDEIRTPRQWGRLSVCRKRSCRWRQWWISPRTPAPRSYYDPRCNSHRWASAARRSIPPIGRTSASVCPTRTRASISTWGPSTCALRGWTGGRRADPD